MVSRAQSSTVGVILLTAVVVITIGTAGVFVFGGIGGDDVVRADLVVIQTNESLTIEHNGGEAIPFSEVTIIVEGNERIRQGVNVSRLTRGDDDQLFEPGERWVWNRSFDPDVAWTVRAFTGESQLPVQRQYPDEGVELPGAEPSESLDEPPTVVVDGTGKARVGGSVSFDASGSRDPDGGELSYEWSFGDGSDNVTGPSVNHTFSSVGTYNVTVNVTDDEGNSALKTKQIEIKDGPDITGPEVSIAQPNGTTVVRGGTTYTIQWSAVDRAAGEPSGVDSVEIRYSPDGGETWQDIEFDGEFEWNVPAANTTDAKVRVNATDGAGNTAGNTTKPFTIDSDRPAVGDVSPNGSAPTYVRSGENVSVSWNATDDTTGVENVSVRIVNGTTVAEETGLPAEGLINLTVSESAPEKNYSVVVEAVDAVGHDRVVNRSNAVVVDNTAPWLRLDVDDESGATGGWRCLLPWVSCWDEQYSYTWSSWDENPYEITSFEVTRNGVPLNVNPSLSDNSSGTLGDGSTPGATYVFNLTAQDRAGNTQYVRIEDDSDLRSPGPEESGTRSGGGTPDSPPTASIDAPKHINVGESVEFDGGESTDPDGGNLDYQWSFGDSSGNESGVSPDHSYDRMGTYTVTLTITDNEGDTDTTTEQVNVGYALNAGGPELDAGGRTYVADQGENPYQVRVRGGSDTYETDDDIDGTEFSELYQTERYGDFGYEVPAADGKYEVTFNFAQISDSPRYFDVNMEERSEIDNLYPAGEVGVNSALIVTRNVSVIDGTLNIEFIGEQQYDAGVNGISIKRVGPVQDTDGDDDEEDGDRGPPWGRSR